MLVNVAGVEVFGEDRLRLTYADGTVGDADLGGRTCVLEPLRDREYFAVGRRPRRWHDRLVRQERHGARAALRRGEPRARVQLLLERAVPKREVEAHVR